MDKANKQQGIFNKANTQSECIFKDQIQKKRWSYSNGVLKQTGSCNTYWLNFTIYSKLITQTIATQSIATDNHRLADASAYTSDTHTHSVHYIDFLRYSCTHNAFHYLHIDSIINAGNFFFHLSLLHRIVVRVVYCRRAIHFVH